MTGEPNPPLTRQLCVSIINYRTGGLTIDCVKSVLADLGEINALIAVVDNASGDGSAEEIAAWIAAQDPPVPVRLIRSATNSGFSGGHNQGIAAARAEYYLILNSDAVLRSGFFATLLAAARTNPRTGFFAPRLTYDDGEVQRSSFRFHSPLGELIRTARTGAVTALFSRHEVALPPEPKPAQIEWASFACILLSGAMVRAIGPMDEGYFLYFEDAEYCLRARRAGWGILRVPEAVAVHFRGGSGPVKTLSAARKRLPPYFYASRTRFLYQAHGRAGLLAANLLCYLGGAIAFAMRVTGKRKRPFAANELSDIWINFARPLGPGLAPWENP